ncbi:MAG: hypothetical protein AB7N91_03695 [Candidatus Tectimicrobiota bacterium]
MPYSRAVLLEPQCVGDLELDRTMEAFIDSRSGRAALREVWCRLCTDPEIITYRQDILQDLWCQPDFAAGLEALLPDLGALAMPSGPGLTERRRVPLHEVTWRLGELESLVRCVDGLAELFSRLGEQLQAAGWCILRERIGQLTAAPVYQHLSRALPEMLRTIRAKASVTIGVNLDSQLRPEAATLLAIHEQKFTASTFLGRLFGRQEKDFQGLGPLHTVPPLRPGSGLPAGQAHDVSPLMVPLFHDLAKVLDTVCRPIAQALGHYETLPSRFLAALHTDILFYLAAVRLMRRVRQQGLPLCRPVIVPTRERICELRGAYNLNLALQQMERVEGPLSIVTNDVHLGEEGRIAILTGPNRGGKTTYLQMIGLCQVLAQLGLWVPATQARLSPVDNIYTHYPVAEQGARGTGRFGDEAQRLSHIFAQSTRSSLILLNESLASTHAGESLYIAQDIVRMLRRLGSRVLFATHLHELAADVAALNASEPGESRIISLVASGDDVQDGSSARSYKIIPGPPLGRSYAREIAAQYGISYEQLQRLLQQRGAID